ncbi:MAG: HNH endonuclease [Candidatus Electrothrix sp.]
MMNEDFAYGFGVDDSTIRAERRKARELRKTRWWQQKTADGTCHYCQHKFPVKELTMDHIIPLSRGGRSTKGNLVPCCKECNTAKKTDLPPALENL